MNEPPRRQIASWQDAEINARDWMRTWGFADAELTRAGADEGLDVRSKKAVAQVKYEARDVGRPYLQQFVGARGRFVDSQMLFFTGSRYSEQAVAYAEEMGIALFHYGLDGRMHAVNNRAADLMKAESAALPQTRWSELSKHPWAPSDTRKAGIWLLIASAATLILLGPGVPVSALLFLLGVCALYMSRKSGA